MTLSMATKQRHTDVTEAETEKQINKSTYFTVKINSNFKDRVVAVFFKIANICETHKLICNICERQ